MEKDPVCGRLVDPLRAVGKRTAGGRIYGAVEKVSGIASRNRL